MTEIEFYLYAEDKELPQIHNGELKMKKLVDENGRDFAWQVLPWKPRLLHQGR